MAARTSRPKAIRTLTDALNRFYKPGSFVPIDSPESKKSFALERMFRFGNNSRLLSEPAIELIRSMTGTLHALSAHRWAASYSDVYSALFSLMEEMAAASLRPSNGQELHEGVDEKLAGQIDDHTFAAPLYGIELVGFDTLPLGRLRIVKADEDWLRAEGVTWNPARFGNVSPKPYQYWLVGSVRGTPRIALERYQSDAELATGMLAVSAACIHEHGATRIRIGVVMSPETAHGAAGWLSWAARNKSLSRHIKFRESQDFRIDEALVAQFKASGLFEKAFEILQAQDKSELGLAVSKAVHWYSDAHREVVPVMKLIKYWSCVETFFSARKVDIVQSVSGGLTAVLVFGGFGFIPQVDYEATKKRVKDLYERRSRAVHAGDHDHVSTRDLATLSQWVSWMILNMVDFIDRGYTELEQVKDMGERLDAKAAGSAA